MRHFFILLLLSLAVRSFATTSVLVSIAPQKYLVERIGGEHVEVEVIVPPGANSHTYEPTPKQVVAIQKGSIWFRLGESFEARLIPVLQKNTCIVDQREGLDLILAGCGCCHAESPHDPHIWLSPRLLKCQAAQIARVLSDKMPEHATLFAARLERLICDLDALDCECRQLFAGECQKPILVSHPAYGYLCRDYGLVQLSIEMEGREPTPKYLTELIAQAKCAGIKTVFLQMQHNPKGGKKIASEIGATTYVLDPYQENVLENIHRIAKLFATS